MIKYTNNGISINIVHHHKPSKYQMAIY